MIVNNNTKMYVGDHEIGQVYNGDQLLYSNYTILNYLEANHVARQWQWIDTGIYFDKDTWMELEVMSLIPVTTSGSVWHQMLGGLDRYHSPTAIQIAHNRSFDTCPLDYGTDGTVESFSVPRNVKFKIQIKDHDHWINNKQVTQKGSFVGKSTYSMWLFGYNRGDAPFDEPFLHCRIYSCKIYQGEQLIRNFVPALNKNNVPCLYDKVEHKFYYNQGSGQFLYG